MKSPMIQCKYSSTSTTFFSVVIFFTTLVVVASDDADYMSRLFESLTPTPPGWSNKTHFCEWNGVVCHQSTTLVHTISLPSTSLTGTLPPDLKTLSNLTHIDLHNNSLYGPLPEFYELMYLQTVNLGHNNFSIEDGTIGLPIALQTLNLSNNLNFTPWVYDMSASESVKTIDLEATNIIGSLSPYLFEIFPRLETLVLSHNTITGTLPDALERHGIKYLKLNGNRFTGSIEVLSSLRLLSQAWLNDNMFNGIIPDFSNSTNLFDLQLGSNFFVGVVPPSLMALSSLKNVSLDNNMLQGPKPVFHTKVKATFGGNSFCRNDIGPCDPQVTILLEISKGFGYPSFDWIGINPCNEWSIFECTKGGKISSIRLSNMTLTGTISPAFANLTSLVNLTLSDNNLTGVIPESLTTLPQLRVLDVSNNNLFGQVPKFSSKVKLNISGNVWGGIPPKDNGTVSDDATTKPKAKATSVRRTLWIALAGASLFGVVVTTLIVIIYKRKKYFGLVQERIFKKTTLLEDNVEDFIKSYKLMLPKRYSYIEVNKITNSFKDRLGHGGYGVVYKAILFDGRAAAVKLINECKGDGEEFINEVVSISRTSHVNIVSLLGFCCEMNKRALIYEFMPNGSFDKFIYRSGSPSAICNLDWNTLYQIVVGIARGLEYLHQGCISRILHLDIKPQNILLNIDFSPKISDFGLAKICQERNSIVSMIGTRGTIGFIAPEVFSRSFGGVSHKSDVYSFGMLVLEMIGGRKNYDTGESNTTEMYFSNWINKDLELTDLENQIPLK